MEAAFGDAGDPFHCNAVSHNVWDELVVFIRDSGPETRKDGTPTRAHRASRAVSETDGMAPSESSRSSSSNLAGGLLGFVCLLNEYHVIFGCWEDLGNCGLL